MKKTPMRDLSADELGGKLTALREELFNLNCQNALRQLDNHMRIRQVRRDVARVRTEITAREKREKGD